MGGKHEIADLLKWRQRAIKFLALMGLGFIGTFLISFILYESSGWSIFSLHWIFEDLVVQLLTLVAYLCLGLGVIGLLAGLVAGTYYLVRKRTILGSKENRTANLEQLINCLNDEETVRDAIKLLEGMRDPRAVEPLVSVLNEHMNDKSIQKDIVLALGKISDKSALSSMMEIYHRGEVDHKLVAGCMRGLKNLDKEAVEPIAEMLKDEDQVVRAIAVGILSKIGKPSIASLTCALEDKAWEVRRQAKKALDRIQENSLHTDTS